MHEGALGLTAVKNLAEQGFEVTAFEKNDHLGGLWKAGAPQHTTVLESTIANFSKQRVCWKNKA